MGRDTIPGPFEAYCEATQSDPAWLTEEVYDLRPGCAVPVEPDDPRDARIAELEAQVTAQARRLADMTARAEAAEAKIKRIQEFCASRCICHHAGMYCPKGMFSGWATSGQCDAWEAPKAWEE